MTLFDINSLAVKFAAARNRLKGILDDIRDEQQAALARRRSALRSAVNEANERQAELASSIAAHPECFEKPRTVIVDGVRFGMTTAKVRVDFAEADEVVAAIKRRLPSLAERLIRVKETPDKEALAELTDEQLDKIGVKRVAGDANAVLIKPADSQIDKLVSALLEDAQEAAGKDLVA